MRFQNSNILTHGRDALMRPPAAYTIDDTTAAAPTSYVDIVMRRKGTICLFALGCGLLALAFTLPQTKLYRSHVSLEFAGLNDNVLNTRDIDPTATGDNSSQAFINTQARVLESTPLLERVIAKVKAGVRPQDPARRKNAIEGLTPVGLSHRVTVRPGEATKLIDVYVDASDPVIAAGLADAMAEEYMALSTEARVTSTERTSGWLTRQVQDARNKLEKSESALQDYARHANLVFTGSQGSVAEDRLKEVQDEYSKAQADRVAKQAIYEGLLAEQPDAVNASLRDTALQDYQLKLSELNRQLADLSTLYQPTYGKVQRLKAQIDQLKSDYSKQHDAALNRLRNDFQTAQRREDMLAKSYRSQQGVVTQEAATTVDYNILKREAETNRAIYEAMLQKVKSYGIASAMQTSNVRIIDPAETPLLPYKPNVPLNTAFGLMGGLFLGLVWVGIKDKGEINVEYPGQTTTVLQSNELGVIPSARLDPYLKSGSARQLPSAAANDHNLHKQLETAMWFCKSSLVAESIRSIRTSMLAQEKSGSPTKVAVITSLNPGHGKTSTVSNLGIAYAELGKRVLIVDADVRNPGLHRVFGLRNEAGLTNLLNEPEPFDSFDIDRSTQATGVPCLSLLSSGPLAAGVSLSSLFHSDRMIEILRRLRESFDAVLIDTPPLTLADARILGPLADGVVLVLRAGDVRMDSVLAAEQMLEQDGAHMIGTVLNNWNPRSNGYGVYPERYHESSYFQGVSSR